MSLIRKKTVLVSGNFNVLHPGHLRLLRFAKDFGEHLVVAVISDELAGNDAHVPEALRLEGVQANSFVNEAFITNEPIDQLILRLQPDIVVKGKEHELRFNSEQNAVKSYGGELIFSSGEAVFSSVDLIHKEFEKLDVRTISMPYEYMDRHEINGKRLRDLIHQFSTLKVCVLGDLIVDEYITCEPLGMSQEDPTVVVTPVDSVRFIGGAGIVAAHASGLGATTHFYTVTGKDEVGKFASDELSTARVQTKFFIDQGRPTTLKQRYRSKGKSLLRVSHLHQGAISSDLQDEIYTEIEQDIDSFDLIVFSDFNYGCLPQKLVDRVISLSQISKKIIVADSQSSSQMGHIGRFKEMDLITPTEREARVSIRNQEDGLVVLAELLRLESCARNILLKMGAEGVLIHANNDTNGDWLTDRVDALNSMPKDVAGAGDSLLIVSAMVLACGGSIWEAACLGSLAAAVQVSRVGNIPLQPEELLMECR